MLVEEAIELRKKRAQEEKFRVKKTGREKLFTDYRVDSLASKKFYRVAIRGFSIGDNYCSCPDYASNTLGTCKHIEAVLGRLRKSVPPKERARKDDNRCEVYLRYGKSLDVCIRYPRLASEGVKRVAAKYFGAESLLPKERYAEFSRFMEEAQNLEEQVTVYGDTIEHIERQLELERGLAEEKILLEKLRQGNLKLSMVNANLYPYQAEGVIFAALRGRTIIGDDMGLGKTIQAIAASELLAKRNGITKVLIVCPASLKYQWQSEIRRFTGKDALVLEGIRKKRIGLYREGDFYKITNYEAVIRDNDIIMAWKPDLIILDEAQRIKNWETRTAKAVKSLKSRYALVLTGTPLENKLAELYSIVQFIDNRQLGPAFQFLKEHVHEDESGRLLGYRGLDKVREKLAPILIRRHKEEVLKDLPAKTENVYYVDMTPQQRNPYDELSGLVAQILAKWKKRKWISEVDRQRLRCFIEQMRMLCDSTYLYDKETNFSPKLEEFKELAREICIENNKKVVVFSQWTRMLEKASEALDKLKIGYVMFHGMVPVKKRGLLIQKFKNDESCKVFFSTDAGGLGLNLQNADTVINFDVPWNPAVLNQRIGRVHRLGQHNPVTAINLVTRKSIEERVLATIKLKRDLFKGVFEGGATEVDFSALKKESFMNALSRMIEEEQKEREEEKKNSADSFTQPGQESPADAFINAGISFLQSIADSMENGRKAATADGAAFTVREEGTPYSAEQRGDIIREGVSRLITKDPKSGKPVLAIPLPSEDAVKKGIDALSAIFAGMGKK